MNCKNCEGEFESKRKTQVYCSNTCKEKWRSKNRVREPKGLINTVYTCKYCGKEYHPKTKDRKTYCSRECSYADKKAKPKVRPKVTCAVCGKEFEGRPDKRYCSEGCKKELVRRKHREYWTSKKAADVVNEFITKNCKECGDTFTTNLYASRRVFCSDKCSERNQRHTPSARLRHKRDNQTRRARLRGVKIESFNSIEIFERDNWCCQICGEKVDAMLPHPHLMSPTLDHIIPLVKGGTHERENVQLAHFICNSRKSGQYPYLTRGA
ncbi:HNH endonuclease [Desulfosporosinus lacus]|uniref:HNH endonuclease n=1 Tax=Desulfosporosinus lacus DSM 15449 TaxID=1121420 RepID=A0A1M5QJF9_9FIRM|nr:HNH endonuclease signature motif containing protein [Desulfosporosinus lacus]SHH14225.1 HNH endonuclease [Desulfosporosinus lacus DSM 15449]